jgi:hypothetical protein
MLKARALPMHLPFLIFGFRIAACSSCSACGIRRLGFRSLRRICGGEGGREIRFRFLIFFYVTFHNFPIFYQMSNDE